MVLGSGPPGGSWHRMDPNLRTLSLSAWMSLPGLDYNTWMAKQALDANNEIKNQTTCQARQMKLNKQQQQHQQHMNSNQNTKNHENNWWRCFSGGNSPIYNNNSSSTGNIGNSDKQHIENLNKNDEPSAVQVKLQTNNSNGVTTELVLTPTVPRRVLSVRRKVSREVQTRALVCDVAQYYENYVKEMNLERYFHNNTIVTCVKPFVSAVNKNVRWLVRGIQGDGTQFAYCCRSIVLANGAADLANRLGVSGEGSQDWVKHDLPALESILEKVPDNERPSKCSRISVDCTDKSQKSSVHKNLMVSILITLLYRNETRVGSWCWSFSSRCCFNLSIVWHQCDSRLSESFCWT